MRNVSVLLIALSLSGCWWDSNDNGASTPAPAGSLTDTPTGTDAPSTQSNAVSLLPNSLRANAIALEYPIVGNTVPASLKPPVAP